MRFSPVVVGVLVLVAFLAGIGVGTLFFSLGSDAPTNKGLPAEQVADRDAGAEAESSDSASNAGKDVRNTGADTTPGNTDSARDRARERDESARPSPDGSNPADGSSQDQPKEQPKSGESTPPAPAVPDAVGSELGVLTDLSATISGTVVDSLGNPVPNAEVISDVIERAGQTTRASSAGKFAGTDSGGNFTGVVKLKVGSKAAVTLALRAKAKGHAENRHVQVRVKAGDEKTGVKIPLRACGTVRGKVVNTSQTGVPGAKVTLEPRDPEEGLIRDEAGNTVSFGGSFSATTDAGGEYTVEDVPEGSYNFALSAPGYKERTGPRSADVQAGNATQVENFEVAATTSIRARLMTDDGKPVFGYATFEFSTPEGEIVKQLRSMVSADGSVVINNPPVGAFNVSVRMQGYQPTAKTWQTFVQDQQTDMGTLTMLPAQKTQESKAVMQR